MDSTNSDLDEFIFDPTLGPTILTVSEFYILQKLKLLIFAKLRIGFRQTANRVSPNCESGFAKLRIGFRQTANRGRNTANRGRKTANRGRKPANRGRKTANRGRKTANRGRHTVN